MTRAWIASKASLRLPPGLIIFLSAAKICSQTDRGKRADAETSSRSGGRTTRRQRTGKRRRAFPIPRGPLLDPRMVSFSRNSYSSGAFRELGGTLSSEPRCLTPPSKNCTRNRLSEIGSGLRGNLFSKPASRQPPFPLLPPPLLFLSRVFPLSSWMPPPSGLQQQQQKPLPPTPSSPSSHRPNLSLDTSTNETAEGPFSPPSVVLDTPSSFGTPYMDSEDSPEGDYSSRRNGEGSSGGSLQVGLEVEPPLGAVSPSPSSPSVPFLFPITMERRGLKGREDASEWNPAMQSVVEEPFGLWEVRLTG